MYTVKKVFLRISYCLTLITAIAISLKVAEGTDYEMAIVSWDWRYVHYYYAALIAFVTTGIMFFLDPSFKSYYVIGLGISLTFTGVYVFQALGVILIGMGYLFVSKKLDNER